MHQPIRAHHLAAEDIADALVPQADAEQGSRCAEGADHVIGNARLVRRARARARSRCVSGLQSRDFLHVISSLRFTTISAPSSPKYWTRL